MMQRISEAFQRWVRKKEQDQLRSLLFAKPLSQKPNCKLAAKLQTSLSLPKRFMVN
jgi:F0F1-type ATP synthase delta subunit